MYQTDPRVYLAAPWVDRENMDARAEMFEKAGFEISHKWWKTEDNNDTATDEKMRRHAYLDYAGVKSADAVVVFNTGKSEGKAVELGLALGLRRPIVMVGTRGEHSKNVFHYMDECHWVETIEQATAKTGEVIFG